MGITKATMYAIVLPQTLSSMYNFDNGLDPCCLELYLSDCVHEALKLYKVKPSLTFFNHSEGVTPLQDCCQVIVVKLSSI